MIMNKEAVMVVDYQKWFWNPDVNELYVQWWETIAPVINEVMSDVRRKLWIVVASRDMHKPWNISFAQNFVWKKPITEVWPCWESILTYEEIKNWTDEDNWLSWSAWFTVKELKDYVKSCTDETAIMWPWHCVINTPWSEYQDWFDVSSIDFEVAKWYKNWVHPYSAEPGIEIWTTRSLVDVFGDELVKKIKVVWLASDYCVKDTALDLAKTGRFIVDLIMKWTKSVDASTEVEALAKMRDAWVNIIEW